MARLSGNVFQTTTLWGGNFRGVCSLRGEGLPGKKFSVMYSCSAWPNWVQTSFKPPRYEEVAKLNANVFQTTTLWGGNLKGSLLTSGGERLLWKNIYCDICMCSAWPNKEETSFKPSRYGESIFGGCKTPQKRKKAPNINIVVKFLFNMSVLARTKFFRFFLCHI
jgi:hypothetical protein